jgi:hypothetical protein
MAGGASGSTVTFGTQVTDWVRQTQARMDAVFRESTQRVVEEMQTPVAQGGNMPVDTGFLRASLQMTKDAPSPIDAKAKPADGKAYAYNPDSVALVIAGATIGDTLFASYTASYALPVHYGWEAREATEAKDGQAAKPARKSRAGRQWVTMAAQHWPQIVAAVCAETQSAVQAKQGGSPSQEL